MKKIIINYLKKIKIGLYGFNHLLPNPYKFPKLSCDMHNMHNFINITHVYFPNIFVYGTLDFF